jgi:branched-chain amino acid transport system substrate-binding protein
MPGNVAAFAYDAAQELMHSIITAGTDREMIQKTLLEKQFNGVTGPIQFDKRGNRNGNVTLVRISNGIPVELKK